MVEFLKDIYNKLKYNGLSINSKKANSLRYKNDKKALNKIIKDINSLIKKSSCNCEENIFYFTCNSAYDGYKYFLIKYDRKQKPLSKKHFNFLINYYIDKGFVVSYLKRSNRASSCSPKREIRIKKDTLFDIKSLEPIDPEECNFYIEW